ARSSATPGPTTSPATGRPGRGRRCPASCSSWTSSRSSSSRTTSWPRKRRCCSIGWCGRGRPSGRPALSGRRPPAGAYSLARSTIDQMAVRIALQCSDADAQLILSKDNTAARLLSRPGEAIYNDQNGMVEGNDPFQVVWLGDERRERYLADIQQRADG